MKILVCQISPKVGAINENFATIKELYIKACESNADICVFPELSTSGYLAEDLFLEQPFIEEIQQNLDRLIKEIKDTCLLISTPIEIGGCLFNAVIAAQNGRIIGKTYKHQLPNYGIFDEKRYFTAGVPAVITINGIKIGVPICEDIWFPEICAQ